MSFTEHKVRRINSDPQVQCHNYGVIKTFSNLKLDPCLSN